jgi:hypothetical protein
MYLSIQQIFPAQLSKSMTCRTDYRTQTPVKLHRRVSISHGMILMIEQNRERRGGGGVEHTWKFFSISNNRFRPVSAIFLSVWRNAHIIESITSFSCWYWTWDRRLQFNGEKIVKRLPLKFTLLLTIIVQLISPLLQLFIYLSDVV